MRVAVVGAGLSGSLVAALLLERGAHVDLIERSGVFGLGLAYSTTNPSHRLNVRSGRMSALDGDPGHFVRWLEDTGAWSADPDAFAPRQVYGQYVQALLAAAEAGHPGRLRRLTGEGAALTPSGLTLSDGTTLDADAVILATGNPAPRTAEAGQAGVIADPWARGALDGIGPEDDVVLLGSGLTMIDVVLSLQDRGWRGLATALSRRGLAPRAHDPIQTHTTPRRPADAPLSRRLKAFRQHAASVGWGEAMDELRSLNAELWADLSIAERGRFLRHLRPWWDVHRHRIALDVASRTDSLIAEDRLRVHAGRLVAVETEGEGVRVLWRPRGVARTGTLPGRALIDCTGPGHDPTTSPERLIQNLLASGKARADPLRLGLETDREGRILDARGQASDRLFVIGPPSRAAVWEIVAVPDIRRQARQLADLVTSNPRAA